MFLFCSIITVLLFIAYQDLQYRAVSWFLFPLGIVLMIWWGYDGYNWELVLESQLLNLFLLVSQLLLMFMFFRFKQVGFKTLLKQYMGLGDLLFFLLLALSLPTVAFLAFHIISLILSLSLGLLVFRHKTIPLAGLQAFMLAILLCLTELLPIDLHQLDLIAL